jgi:hypothetical protein
MKWILGIVSLVAIAAAWMWLQGDKERFDVVRANVTGAVNELTVARDTVSAEFARGKTMPAPRDFPTTSKHVRGIKLEPDGKLVATLSFPESASADGKHIVYEPRINGANLDWRCHSPDLEKKFLPASCR